MTKARDININVNVDFKPLISQLQEVIDAIDDLNDTLETSKGAKPAKVVVDDVDLLPRLAYYFQAPAFRRAPQFDPEEGWVNPTYPAEDDQ